MKGLLDDDNWVDNVKSDKRMSVFYAVRYLPDSFVEKNAPFNRLASKNSIKWYTLRNIANNIR